VAAAASGIDQAIILSAHADPRHQIALERACEDANACSGILALSPAGALFSASQLGLEAPAGTSVIAMQEQAPHDFHAGWIETSMMLELDEALVARDYVDLPPVEITPREMADPRVVAERTRGRGWLGSPALATRGLGRELLAKSGDFLERAATALVERRGWEAYSRHYLRDKPFFQADGA
jgi:creatinine amidohydrolase